MNRNYAQLHLGLKFLFGPCGKTPYYYSQKDSAYRNYESRAIIRASHPSALHWQWNSLFTGNSE